MPAIEQRNPENRTMNAITHTLASTTGFPVRCTVDGHAVNLTLPTQRAADLVLAALRKAAPVAAPTGKPGQALLVALRTVSRAAAARTTIPVLECVRMSARDGTLTLVCTDMDRAITAR